MYALTENSIIIGYTNSPNNETATPVNESSPEWLDYMLTQARKDKIKAIKAEALLRISAAVPAIDSIAMVNFMVELWPALDTASFGPDMILAKDIYVYAKGNIQFSQTASQTQLDAYDPGTDTGWP